MAVDGDDVLHLHRFEDCDRLAFADRVVGGDVERDQGALNRSYQSHRTVGSELRACVTALLGLLGLP